MSPIPGIVASQISGHLAAPNSYESIATVYIASGTQSSISFTSIPSTFKHLQLRGITRNNRNDNGGQSLTMSINGDTTYTNYRSHLLYGVGSGSGAGEANQLSGYYGSIGFVPAANMTASVFAATVIDILDYSSTSKNKTVRTLWGLDSNSTSGYGGMSSFVWTSGSAVTSLDIGSFPSASFVAYSHFALYGIKG